MFRPIQRSELASDTVFMVYFLYMSPSPEQLKHWDMLDQYRTKLETWISNADFPSDQDKIKYLYGFACENTPQGETFIQPVYKNKDGNYMVHFGRSFKQRADFTPKTEENNREGNVRYHPDVNRSEIQYALQSGINLLEKSYTLEGNWIMTIEDITDAMYLLEPDELHKPVMVDFLKWLKDGLEKTSGLNFISLPKPNITFKRQPEEPQKINKSAWSLF